VQILVGDIGGTNARLALAEVEGDSIRLLEQSTVSSQDYPGIAPVVHEFLARTKSTVSHACFGLACPVVETVCVPTNLPWRIELAGLPAELGIPHARVINDFHAVGAGLPYLDADGLAVLHEGVPQPQGVRALLGAGTGLGHAFLTWGERGYTVHASEGGHVDLAALTERQWRLRQVLTMMHGRVSVERVLSGAGLIALYRFVVAEGGGTADEAVRVPADVSVRALAGTDAACVAALEMFVEVYGAVAGNFALTVLATGGLYVGGGIAPQILPKLRDGTFVRAFLEKGRLRPVLKRMPVYVITSPDVALFGAAAVAARMDGEP
jgi:glucokinase